MIKKIGIDIDGVLMDFEKAIRWFFQMPEEFYGSTYVLAPLLTVEKEQRFYQLLHDPFFMCDVVKFIPCTITFLNKLIWDPKLDITIISGREKEVRKATDKLIRDVSGFFGDIIWDKEKWKYDFDCLFEDDPKVIVKVKKQTQVFVPIYKYNEDIGILPNVFRYPKEQIQDCYKIIIKGDE